MKLDKGYTKMGLVVRVIGNGHIGKAVTKRLKSYFDEIKITVGDYAGDCEKIDAGSTSKLRDWLKGSNAVICCLPYTYCINVASVAAELGIAYFDLTEDIHTTAAIKQMKSESVLIPQNGLAPGAVSIIANHVYSGFDSVKNLQIRVGALPLYPNNEMKYYLTWSTAGLINEYCNPCHVIKNGELTTANPLDGYERITVDGIEYEAFNTSGGLGSLCENVSVDNLDYKTIRYVGHHDKMKFLFDDLNLKNNKKDFEKIFDAEIPRTKDDVVIILIKCIGIKNGELVEETYFKKITAKDGMNAIQRSTSAGVCSVFGVWALGHIKKTGFIPQESIDFKQFCSIGEPVYSV